MIHFFPPLTMSLDKILADYRSTFASFQQEERQREELRNSKEYQRLQSMIENYQKVQEGMLAEVPDCREEMEMDKQALIVYMQGNNLKRAGEFKAKTRVKRTVDVPRVLNILGGDLGLLMEYASMTQSNLEEMCDAMPELKNDLKVCVREDGMSIVDIVVV